MVLLGLSLLIACAKVDRAGELCDDDDDGFVEDRRAAETEYPAGDCDDANAAVHPDATEVCNGLDDDCDGVLEDDEATDRSTWYRDADADGAGDPVTTLLSCANSPTGYVANADDCDDADVAVQQHTFYADFDDDEHGDATATTLGCVSPDGFVATSDDCDDTNRKVNPEELELCENGLDDDCDGTRAGCGLFGDRSPLDAAAVFRGPVSDAMFGNLSLIRGDFDGDGVVDLVSGGAVAYGPLTQDRDAVALSGGPFGTGQVRHSTALANGELVVAFLANGQNRVASFSLTGRTIAAGAINIAGNVTDDLGGPLVMLDGGLAAAGQYTSPSIYYFADPASAASTDAADAEILANDRGFGESLAAGDLDGDGQSDLIIGGGLIDSTVGPTVFVYLDRPVGVTSATGSADVQIAGEVGFGLSIDAGDLDDDGTDELYVGSPGANSRTGAVLRFHIGPGTPAVISDGDAGAMWLGTSQQGVGLYAVHVAPPGSNDGAGFLLSGVPGTEAARGAVVVWQDVAADATYDASTQVGTIASTNPEYFGTSIAPLGDIDGDGYTDLAIGAGRASPNGTDSGAAYVFLGSGL